MFNLSQTYIMWRSSRSTSAGKAVLKRIPEQPRSGAHVSVKGNPVNTLRASAFSGYKVL
jgi:hypothetical protein